MNLAAICLTANCLSHARKRGLCIMHYHRFQRAIRGGKGTWEALEQSGEALPPDLTAKRSYLASLVRTRRHG